MRGSSGLVIASLLLAACGGAAPAGSAAGAGGSAGSGGTAAAGSGGQGASGSGGSGGASAGSGGEGGMACTCDPGLRCPDCVPEFVLSFKPLADPHGASVDVEIDATGTGAESLPASVALAATFGGSALTVPAPAGKDGVFHAHLDLAKATPAGDSVELALTATLPDLPAIAPATLTTHIDNAPPRLGGPSFGASIPRNQLLPAEITIDDAHATGADVRVQLVVKNQQPGATWTSPSTSAASSADFALDPARLPLHALTGFDTLVYTATDALGNTASGAVDFRVTRLAWTAAMGAPVTKPLAMLADGSFVVAPDRATDNLVILDHQGAVSSRATIGTAPLTYPPAVGTRGIYVPSEGSLDVVSPADGSITSCSLPAGSFSAPAAIGTLPGHASELAALSGDDGALHVVWNDGSCQLTATSDLSASGSFVTLASAGGVLRAFVGGQGSTTVSIEKIGSDGAIADAGAIVPAGEQIHVQFPVIAVGDSLFASAFGSSITKSFQFTDLSGMASVDTLALPGIVQAPLMLAGGAIFAPTHRGLAALPTSESWLGALVASMGDIQTTPVAGADGTLWVVDSGGKLHAAQLQGTPFDNASFEELWSAAVGGVVHSSPVLTCDGLLVFGSDDGNVYAVATDSPGLDPGAAWPRYQHDNGSTGNAGTSLACP